MWYVYSVIKKNEILPYATKLSQLETILLSEVSQSHTFSVKQLIHLHQIVCVCVCLVVHKITSQWIKYVKIRSKTETTRRKHKGHTMRQSSRRGKKREMTPNYNNNWQMKLQKKKHWVFTQQRKWSAAWKENLKSRKYLQAIHLSRD